MKAEIKRLKPDPTKFLCYPHFPNPYNRPSQQNLDESRLVFNDSKCKAEKQVEEDLKTSVESKKSEAKKKAQAKHKTFLGSKPCREYVENLLSIIPKKCLVYIKKNQTLWKIL